MRRLLFILACLLVGLQLPGCGEDPPRELNKQEIAQLLERGDDYIATQAWVASRVTAEHRAAVESLYDAVTDLLLRPDEPSLAAAREAWREAHQQYRWTQIVLFEPSSDATEVLSRMAAWPVIAEEIDYVRGKPMAGLINDTSVFISQQMLLQEQLTTDRVLMGYHCIEFLLWGEDWRIDAAGQRTFDDFRPSHPRRERRRDMLRYAVGQLLDDSLILYRHWQEGVANNFHGRFAASASPAHFEQILQHFSATIREDIVQDVIDAMLMADNPQHEPATFSDATHNIFPAYADALDALYRGTYGLNRNMLPDTRYGLDKLLEKIDSDLNARILQQLQTLIEHTQVLPAPMDAALASPVGSRKRQKLQTMRQQFLELAESLDEANRKLGF